MIIFLYNTWRTICCTSQRGYVKKFDGVYSDGGVIVETVSEEISDIISSDGSVLVNTGYLYIWCIL